MADGRNGKPLPSTRRHSWPNRAARPAADRSVEPPGHFSSLRAQLLKLLPGGPGQDAQFLRQQNPVRELRQRAQSDVQISSELGIPLLGGTLRNVGGGGEGGSAHLARQAVALLSWERLRCAVYREGQLVASLPGSETLVGHHAHKVRWA